MAKMAYRCELINGEVKVAPQELQDKHYFRKHGVNAYYGQNQCENNGGQGAVREFIDFLLLDM